eukprot:m.175359 g.175359  ORF g.175359 m.175359 type:complete len:322 (+) comp14610_c0_seq3:488-1453(+)
MPKSKHKSKAVTGPTTPNFEKLLRLSGKSTDEVAQALGLDNTSMHNVLNNRVKALERWVPVYAKCVFLSRNGLLKLLGYNAPSPQSDASVMLATPRDACDVDDSCQAVRPTSPHLFTMMLARDPLVSAPLPPIEEDPAAEDQAEQEALKEQRKREQHLLQRAQQQAAILFLCSANADETDSADMVPSPSAEQAAAHTSVCKPEAQSSSCASGVDDGCDEERDEGADEDKGADDSLSLQVPRRPSVGRRAFELLKRQGDHIVAHFKTSVITGWRGWERYRLTEDQVNDFFAGRSKEAEAVADFLLELGLATDVFRLFSILTK